MALETIVDQPRAVTLLRRALESGRVAHAYAFVGPAGSGRTTAALLWAAALLCERGGCGACRACRLVASRQHPDLHLVVPTPPEKNPRGPRAIRIDAIREVERRAALAPAMALRKVFVLDDADRMTEETPQAFLKVLEEPSATTHFVLVLTRARALPATVLSRCQGVRFEAREDPRVAAARAEAFALLDAVRAKGVEALFRGADRLDRDRAEGLVDAYWLVYRDLLLVKSGAPRALLANAERAGDLAREAERWTVEGLLGAIEACRQAREALGHNVAPRLTVEVVLSRLALGAA